MEKSVKKRLQSLAQKKYRQQYKEYTIEGIKIINEALEAKASILHIFISGERAEEGDVKEIMKKAAAQNIYYEVVKKKEYDAISQLSTPPGVLAHLKIQEQELNKDENIIVLDSVQDPGNVGTIIRTADWFGVKNIVLGEGCVDVYNSKTLSASMGSVFHINLLQEQDLPSILKALKKTHNVIALTIDGTAELKTMDGPFVLVVGSESHGVSKEVLTLADARYTIEGQGKAESLNAAIAHGIALYSLVQK